MKLLFLLVTLLISSNAIAKDFIDYCKSTTLSDEEKRTLDAIKGWRSGSCESVERWINQSGYINTTDVVLNDLGPLNGLHIRNLQIQVGDNIDIDAQLPSEPQHQYQYFAQTHNIYLS